MNQALFVNWSDYEFIAEEPAEGWVRQKPIMLTGWETIVFEIGDDDDEESATSSRRPAGPRQ